MRMVVDSNYLQHTALRDYLSESKQHYAVLTDYAAMEAYKGEGLKTIFRSMEILGQFPSQVIVLKGTGDICALRGRGAGLQRRMIDHRQTEGFTDYCTKLHRARNGDKSLEGALLKHSRAANEHMAIVMRDVADLPEVFADVAADFKSEDLTIFRKKAAYTNELFDKVVKDVMTLSAVLFSRHPKVRRLPPLHELANTYPFRFALCAYLLFERWVANGKPKEIKPEKLRNDMVDLSFATYGTFFDGLLSHDAKLTEIHSDAQIMLRVIVREFGL